MIAHEQKDFDVAVERYRQFLDIEPDHAQTHYNLGLVLNQLACVPSTSNMCSALICTPITAAETRAWSVAVGYRHSQWQNMCLPVTNIRRWNPKSARSLSKELWPVSSYGMEAADRARSASVYSRNREVNVAILDSRSVFRNAPAGRKLCPSHLNLSGQADIEHFLKSELILPHRR